VISRRAAYVMQMAASDPKRTTQTQAQWAAHFTATMV
jgi:hypothetical protein